MTHNRIDRSAFANHLARISTASTLKFLMDKDTAPVIVELRNSLQADYSHLDNIDHATEVYTNILTAIRTATEEKTLLEKACAEMRKALKVAEGNEYETIRAEYLDTLDTIKRLTREIAENRAERDIIEPFFDYTLSDAYDLHNDAYTAIIEAMREPIVSDYLDTLDRMGVTDFDEVATALRGVVVYRLPYKTKEGYREYTLKKWGDRAIQKRINAMRSGIASKTVYLVTGYDDEGNELYIKADAMTTAGGLDSIDRAEEFREFCENLNLTADELTICRYLMNGKTQSDLARRFGVSQQAISKRINKLRDKINERK